MTMKVRKLTTEVNEVEHTRMSIFRTDDNEKLYNANLVNVNEIYLDGGKKVDLSMITDNSAITYLHCNFRPDFSQLPVNLKELSIQTQYEVWRKDLPINLKRLSIATPCCSPVLFQLRQDDDEDYRMCEYFYISTREFGKYNNFKQGLFEIESDNIHIYGDTYTKWFNRMVDGDPNFR